VDEHKEIKIEAQEIIRMLVASIKTLKKKGKK